MKSAVLVLAALVLTGCQSMQKEASVQPAESPTSGYVCNADEMQHLVGFAKDDVVLESLPGPVRVLRPNSIATMDMRPDRINLHTDDDSVIIRVTCG